MSSNVFLVHGDDEFRVSEKARSIVDELVPREDRDFGLETIDGRADKVDGVVDVLERVLAALRTPGFLGNRKVVWLRDATWLGDTVPARSNVVKERLAPLTEAIKKGLDPDTILVVSGGKADKRKAFYKACRDAGSEFEYAVAKQGWMNEKDAREFAVGAFKREGLTPESGALDLFLTKVGTDSRTIDSEVRKLAVYLGENGRVGRADVEAVTSAAREAIAWDLLDAVGMRRLGDAVAALRRLLFQKQSAVGLVLFVANRIRDLMVFREALDRGWLDVRGSSKGTRLNWNAVPPEVAEAYETMGKDPRKHHSFYAGKLAEQASGFSLRRLAYCQKVAMDAHMQMVSSSMPDSVVLELMLARMLAR